MSSRYAQFIAANNALFACMEGTSAESYKAMTPCAQAEVCKAETATVQDFLKNDDCSFRNLLASRIENMSTQM